MNYFSHARPFLDQPYFVAGTAMPDLLRVVIESALEQILGRRVEHIGKLIRRFSIERFMYDYLEDVRLLKRLNQIMARVGLAALPIAMLNWLPIARQTVYNQASDLLPGYGLSLEPQKSEA